MFRLTREVRFAINTTAAAPASAPANAYAGFPSINGLAHYFTLAVSVVGELNADSSYLLNIKDIDAEVRQRAIPLIEDVVKHCPRNFGHATLVELARVLDG